MFFFQNFKKKNKIKTKLINKKILKMIKDFINPQKKKKIKKDLPMQ